MEDPLTPFPYPFWYLDNAEILLTDYKRELEKKNLDQKADLISRHLTRGVSRGFPPGELIDEGVERITRELRPSCFGYVCSLVASEFPYTFLHWCQSGVLAIQVRRLIGSCAPVLAELGSGLEEKGPHQVFTAIRACARHYLETSSQLRLPATYESMRASQKKKRAGLKKTQKNQGGSPALAISRSLTSRSGNAEKKWVASGKEHGYSKTGANLRDGYRSETRVSVPWVKKLVMHMLIAVISFLLTDLTAQFHRINPAASFCLFAGATYLIVRLVDKWKG